MSIKIHRMSEIGVELKQIIDLDVGLKNYIFSLFLFFILDKCELSKFKIKNDIVH